ncbi:hypothetical protein ACNKHU_24785 [Shigella flexneri]
MSAVWADARPRNLQGEFTCRAAGTLWLGRRAAKLAVVSSRSGEQVRSFLDDEYRGR